MVEMKEMILIVFVLLVDESATDREMCDSTSSWTLGVTITWPNTTDRILSDPICLDQNKEFVYRDCRHGQWSSDFSCITFQLPTLPECPTSFKDKGDLCYQLSPESTFPPKCPFENVAPFDAYKKIITEDNLGPVWVPANRTGLGFIKWIEPSTMYKLEVENYTATQPVADKNCLIFSAEGLEAVSCQDKYRGVCAYQKLDRLSENWCDSDCVPSDFSTKAPCFCRVQNMISLNFLQAEFLKPYQTNLSRLLTNDSCAIGLKKIDGRYNWTNSQQEIEYTFWSRDTIFGDEYVYGAVTPNGYWTLTKRRITSCTLFQQEVADVKPTLQLTFTKLGYQGGYFILIVTNVKQMKTLFCFTTGQRLNLVHIPLSVHENTDATDEYLFIPSSSGFYWCEGVKYFDFSVVKTDPYLYKPDNFLEFVAILQVQYPADFNPLSSNFTNFVTSLLVNNDSSYAVKIMKITDLDEDKQQVTFNVHFSLQVDDSSDDETCYQKLQTHLKTLLKSLDTIIEMVDYRSADFCISVHDTLSWPKSPIDSVVNPLEFCFTPDGTLVTRLCDGNFEDGAQWAPFPECEIFEESSSTEVLLQAFQNSSFYALNEMLLVSQDYTEILALDVYLMGKTYSEYYNIPHIEIFAETASNLMKVDQNVLMEAQLKLGATDKLLYFVDNVVPVYGRSFEVPLHNFFFVSYQSKDLSGLTVQKTNGKYVITKLIGDQSQEDITKIENLESAIWLSPELRKNVKDEEKVTFAVYYNDAFFLQSETIHTSIIFGMITPKTSTYTTGPIQILHRVESYRRAKYHCAFWGYSLEDRGSWKQYGTADSTPPFISCQFWHSANYALLTPKSVAESTNVTDDLANLLDSNSSVPQTMEELSHISEKYRQFDAVDVSYVGKILEKVSDSKEVNLQYLATTVNNLQGVKRDVLLQSQKDEDATDSILSHVDTIAQNYDERNFLVSTERFLVAVVDLSDDFSGLVLLGTNTCLKPKILNGTVSVDDIINQDDFDSAVLLSSELKHQIDLEAKIIITMYSVDSLFNEKSPDQKVVSKIFGVILPNVENFKGPVSVLYRANRTTDDCAYWYYDHLHNISGFWKKDGEIGNWSQVVQCDFWHTTHFAFLIIDEDKIDDDDICHMLDLLTTVNCLISMVCLVIILLTAACFRQWRENTGNKILVNFSLVIILQIVVFYISTTINHDQDYLFCTIIGILLHYSIISQFCWMLVVAILQFRRFVTVLEAPPSFILLKACVCGWILPLLPVACVFALDRKNYVKSHVGLCYPSGRGLYLGVWLPVALIIVINFIIFSITLFNVVRKKTECINVGNCDGFYQLRLAVLLFFTLGFTWSFGFLAELENGLVFEYLFCMTATLQGFILFLFFILLNANTRYLYCNALGRCCKRKFR